LLFTVLNNQFWSLDLTNSVANLPVTINNFVNNPDPNWKKLAWSGALLITIAVLSLNIAARVIGSSRSEK
jgi:phosphate transport system permease protein